LWLILPQRPQVFLSLCLRCLLSSQSFVNKLCNYTTEIHKGFAEIHKVLFNLAKTQNFVSRRF